MFTKRLHILKQTTTPKCPLCNKESILSLFIRRELGTSQSICRDKNFWPIFVMKTVRKHSKILKTQETDHRQTELKNMLVK